ncbi:MAG TPA: NAD(P)H-hydrate dehydratase, partial [Bacteroidota bacterium]|nr:NAD(P)H-hydrate dehydratase [Bacteroidota bacterium]
MQLFDAYAIKRLKISGLVLMENAGRGVVDAMQSQFGSLAGKRILVVCGKGNNGGDGFVIARHLNNLGSVVTVCLLGRSSELKGDARTNFAIIEKIMSDGETGLQILSLKSTQVLNRISPLDIIVDAILGTGFNGKITGVYKKVIDWINTSSANRVSVDIPSGMNADTGSPMPVAVKSNLTVTMGFKKIGFVSPAADRYLGSLVVTSIGAPQMVPTSLGLHTFEIKAEDIREAIPGRARNVHKYSFLKVFVFAGSRGYTGAAAMTTQAVLRSGGAMVTLGTPKSVYPILARKLTEAMVVPLAETSEGSIAASDELERHLDWADVIIMGPGLSRNKETGMLIRNVFKKYAKRFLIDADGLNALAEEPSLLKKNKNENVILTPHTGELSRLIRVNARSIEGNRIEIARETARKLNVTLVLKGVPTVTATPHGVAYVNSTGNPGMASAGMGDILSGIIGGLWAQGLEGVSAAYCGVYLHGLSGDLGRDALGEKSLLATDLLTYLPNAFEKIK